MLVFNRVWIITIAGFVVEIGDIRRLKSSRLIQKYADLYWLKTVSESINENRGLVKNVRRNLFTILYQMMIQLLVSDEVVREV